MPTQKDIARRLGLSQMTVSRAMDAAAPVSQRTRARVLREVRRRGYALNLNARNLVARRRGALGVVVAGPESFPSFYFLPALRGISDVVADERLNELLITVRDAQGQAGRLADVADRMDAFVVFNFAEMRPLLREVLSVLGRSRHRTVLIQSHRGRADAPYLTVDNALGAGLATAHLLGLGHRRIACVGLEYDSAETRARLVGYRKACARAGVPEDPDMVLHEFRREESGPLDRLMARPSASRPTAIFAFSDRVARVAIFACLRAGLRVPEDVSVVGFNDDEPFVTMMRPHLTTVRQPLYELGLEAARAALALSRGDRRARRNRVLQPELVVRESTRPAA